MTAAGTIAFLIFFLFSGAALPGRAGESSGSYTEALKLHKAGKLKEAITRYDQAIKADPRFAEAYIGRGAAYARLGQRERAIKDYDEAIQINPKLPDAYYNRGNAFDDLKQHERA